jgi:hypothetical protein
MAWVAYRVPMLLIKISVGSGDRRDSKIDLVLELIGADYGGQMLLETL